MTLREPQEPEPKQISRWELFPEETQRLETRSPPAVFALTHVVYFYERALVPAEWSS